MPSGVPFSHDGRRIYFQYNINDKTGRIYLIYCPFCGKELFNSEQNLLSETGLSEEQMTLLEKKLSSIVTREDLLSHLGHPSRTIARKNGKEIELHYENTSEGVSIVVIDGADGTLRIMYGPQNKR